MPKKVQVIETSRGLIEDEEFKKRNRQSEKLFTRLRRLPFALVLIMILRKSTKSLQCIVNETVSGLGLEEISALVPALLGKRVFTGTIQDETYCIY
jgi:hypothetical protein